MNRLIFFILTFSLAYALVATAADEVSYDQLVSEIAQKKQQTHEVRPVENLKLLHVSLLTGIDDVHTNAGSSSKQLNGFQVFWGEDLSPNVFAGLIGRGWMQNDPAEDRRSILELDLSVRKICRFSRKITLLKPALDLGQGTLPTAQIRSDSPKPIPD